MTLITPSNRNTRHHQKRGGLHHRHSNHYLKHYWPYLPLIAIIGLGLGVNSVWPAKSNVLGYATDMSVATLLKDTNVQRADDQENTLRLSSRLTAAAQAKARDMAKRNYWSHNMPDGKAPWSFITKAGYNYQKAGENLAYGFSDAADTITGWMNSPEHRANILNASYSDVGFGLANIPNYQNNGPETLVVAMYAQPATVKGAATQLSAGAPTLHQSAPTGVQSIAEPASQHIARIQLLTSGNAPWSLFAVSVLASVSALIFVTRHGLLWRRALKRSGAFITSHPYFDVAIFILVVVGYLLSRSAGVIR